MTNSFSNVRPNEKEAIKNLQRYLRQISYDSPTVTPPPIDGIFSVSTESALKDYQTSRGISPTGCADHQTWDALYDDYLKSISKNSAPAAINPFPRFPTDYKIGEGSKGFLVELIQYILNELSAIYVEIPVNSQSGVWGKETTDAVKLFQRIHGYAVTGYVDRQTWNALVTSFNLWNEKNQ